MARINHITRRDKATGEIRDHYSLRPVVPVQLTPAQMRAHRRRAIRAAYEAGHLGLGDVVELAARPIALHIDALTGRLAAWLARHTTYRLKPTAVAGCGACSKRRAWLNRLMPHVRRWWRLKWPFPPRPRPL